VKNLNSFRSVERAIAFEVKRQIALIESGGKVVQETRGWDESKQETFHQRFKEGSADYRYFPEPDLPKLYLSEISEFASDSIRASLPELPWERRARYQEKGLSPEYTEMFLGDDRFGNLFEQTTTLEPGATTLIANYVGSDIAGLVSKFGDDGLKHISPLGLSVVMKGVVAGTVSSRGAKDAITEVFTKGGDLAEVVQKYLQQSDEGALGKIVDAVLAREEKVVAEYKAGKQSALQYLIGKCMKESAGSGNPASLKKLLEEKLK
jgi:aspartyl-tRNA(Asn)/glutamyl-tRNA(Gln) amidotransferase subunit B